MVSNPAQHHRLFFGPAWRLSVAAVAAVAVVAMAAWLLGPLFGGGPVGNETPGPGASASATAEPTPSAEATATVEPTAAPTPGVAAWTGLNWAVGSVDEGKWLQFNDVLPWRGGYVGVGSSRASEGDTPTSLVSPAFFTSADGLHWTIAQEGEPIDNGYQSPEDLLPAHLVPIGDTLLAVGSTPFGTGAPMLWSTDDGSTWTLLDNSNWRDALATNTLISVAAGPSGVVIVATEGNICCANPQGPAGDHPLIIWRDLGSA